MGWILEICSQLEAQNTKRLAWLGTEPPQANVEAYLKHWHEDVVTPVINDYGEKRIAVRYLQNSKPCETQAIISLKGLHPTFKHIINAFLLHFLILLLAVKVFISFIFFLEACVKCSRS